MTWGFVDEPKDIESFALVSKWVYSLSTRFVREHARLKRLLPTFSIQVETDPNGPHEVLELLLQNPRLGLYVHKALIEDWRVPGSERNISVASLSPERIVEFESAVRCSPYIPPSEEERWVRKIKKGNPDPIVALIMMRLTRLRQLRLVYPYTGGNVYLNTTLKRMTLVPDGANNLGPSAEQSEPGDGSQTRFERRPSSFCNIKEMEMNLGGIKMKVLSKLLQGVKDLESFSFTSSPGTTFDFPRLNRALLRCSRASLQKLILHDDTESQLYLGPLIGFHNLVELKVNVSFLLGCHDEPQKRLIHTLPKCLQVLSLYLGETARLEEVEDVANQVVECKMEQCPRLERLWVEMMDPEEMDEEEACQLMEYVVDKLAEVVVQLDMGLYSNFYMSAAHREFAEGMRELIGARFLSLMA